MLIPNYSENKNKKELTLDLREVLHPHQNLISKSCILQAPLKEY